MDFGDILSQWETLKKKEPKDIHKCSENSRSKAPEKTVNPMEMWMRRYGVIDKDAAADEYDQRLKLEDRAYLKAMSPQSRLDLHGLTREEAWQRLDGFISECKLKGLRKVLIIHGKGNHSHGSDPVLGATVRSFIETDKRLGASGHPNRNMGGSGATWVVIR